jgi:cytochrome c peroxidase
MDEQREALSALTGPARAVAVPAGTSAAFWQSLVPKDNPRTEAQIALGRTLYFDTRLSKDGTRLGRWRARPD